MKQTISQYSDKQPIFKRYLEPCMLQLLSQRVIQSIKEHSKWRGVLNLLNSLIELATVAKICNQGKTLVIDKETKEIIEVCTW